MTHSARSVALVRATAPHEAERIISEIEPYFGNHVYAIIDAYHDDDAPAISKTGSVVSVGRKFLDLHGLPYFKDVGWQCGDFMYYAASQALPGYEYYWLIEHDVSVRIDAKTFFASCDTVDHDLIIKSPSKASRHWMWHESMEDFAAGEVHKGLYSITRLSRRAIARLFERRKEYSSTPFAQNRTWSIGRANLYANDEAFTSTMIVAENFSRIDIASLSAPEIFQRLTLLVAVHPDELPFITNSIVHPVCVAPKSSVKYLTLADDLERNFATLLRRRREFQERLPQADWETFSGIPSEALDRQAYLPRRETAIFYCKQLLDLLKESFASPVQEAVLSECLIHQDTMSVMNFETLGVRLAFHIRPRFEDAAGSRVTGFSLELVFPPEHASNLSEQIYFQKIDNGKFLIAEVEQNMPPDRLAGDVFIYIESALYVIRLSMTEAM